MVSWQYGVFCDEDSYEPWIYISLNYNRSMAYQLPEIIDQGYRYRYRYPGSDPYILPFLTRPAVDIAVNKIDI